MNKKHECLFYLTDLKLYDIINIIHKLMLIVTVTSINNSEISTINPQNNIEQTQGAIQEIQQSKDNISKLVIATGVENIKLKGWDFYGKMSYLQQTYG